MSSMFTQAPVIGRDTGRGLYVEAAGTEREPDHDLALQRLAITYGHLVEAGEKLTGAQWAQQIAINHASRPGVEKHVQYIRRAMLVDRFQDDFLLFREPGVAVFRGTAAACEATRDARWRSATVQPVAACSGGELFFAELYMAQAEIEAAGGRLEWVKDPVRPGHGAFAAHFLSISDPDRFHVHAPAGPLASALSLLQHKCVGAETFSDEENADEEGAYRAMSSMTRHLGYSSLVTAKPPMERSHAGGAQACVTGALDGDAIASRLDGFLSEMLERGWDPSKPVFLCRPAPMLNPVASIRHFESILHSQLIAWRLPSALVQRVVQRIKARQADAGDQPGEGAKHDSQERRYERQ